MIAWRNKRPQSQASILSRKSWRWHREPCVGYRWISRRNCCPNSECIHQRHINIKGLLWLSISPYMKDLFLHVEQPESMRSSGSLILMCESNLLAKKTSKNSSKKKVCNGICNTRLSTSTITPASYISTLRSSRDSTVSSLACLSLFKGALSITSETHTLKGSLPF